MAKALSINGAKRGPRLVMRLSKEAEAWILFLSLVSLIVKLLPPSWEGRTMFIKPGEVFVGWPGL